MHGHAEREPERVGGHQADAQPGVRTGAHTDDDAGDGVEARARLGEDPVDGGQQEFPVPTRVHLARRGDDGRSVVQGDGDGGVAVSRASKSTQTAYGADARRTAGPVRAVPAATVTAMEYDAVGP